MDESLRLELARAKESAARARALVVAARRAGGSAGEATRRRREVDLLEDAGRDAVLECLEAGELALAVTVAQRLTAALEEEADRTRRAARLPRGVEAGR